jgi:UTP--glucose-1-phosphate uridylyltransferase
LWRRKDIRTGRLIRKINIRRRPLEIRKAVIPAAGFGTRFLPATKAQPKEMLSVVDKPLIQYSVEEAVGSGIDRIGVIVSRGKDSIADHFDKAPELEEFLKEKGKQDFLKEVQRITDLAEFTYIRQKQALGLGHAVLRAEDYIGNEPFAVLLPDDIFDCVKPCTRQLIDAYHEFKGSVIVLGRVDEEGTKKYGIVKPKQISDRVFEIEDMIEKPGPEKAYSDLAIIGRYIFDIEIFQAIKKTQPDQKGEIQLTKAIKILLQSRPVYGYLFEGTRYDAGDKLGFIQATMELALKRPEFGQLLKNGVRH